MPTFAALSLYSLHYAASSLTIPSLIVTIQSIQGQNYGAGARPDNGGGGGGGGGRRHNNGRAAQYAQGGGQNTKTLGRGKQTMAKGVTLAKEKTRDLGKWLGVGVSGFARLNYCMSHDRVEYIRLSV